MKRWYIFVGVVILVGVSLFLLRDKLARIAWQNYHKPALALLLNGNDGGLAMQLGNYYFNGPSCVKTLEGKGCYDLAKAEKAYRKAAALNPQILWGHYQLARIYFLQGKFAEALGEINEELRLHPDSYRSYYVRGLINGYAGSYAAAISDFETFLKYEPKSWAAHNDLAWIYTRSGNFIKAIEATRAGLAWNPDNPWLLSTHGVAFLNIGKYTEAAAELESSIQASYSLTPASWGRAYPGNDPNSYLSGLAEMRAVIHLNLGIAYEKLNRRDEARREFETFLRLASSASPYRAFVKNQLKAITL